MTFKHMHHVCLTQSNEVYGSEYKYELIFEVCFNFECPTSYSKILAAYEYTKVLELAIKKNTI